MSSVLELRCHPDTPCDAVEALTVTAERGTGGRLELRYRVTGAVGRLALPALRDAGRAGELWRTTCFELFVRAGDGPGYREYNFAPSLDWAAYDFTGYRAGMADAPTAAPLLALVRRTDRLELAAHLRLPSDAPVRIGLSAVIDLGGGAVSYWALAHPAGKPDFHDAACFAAPLAAPSGA